jgi:membrane-bound serine protease (ClpP class)
MHFWIWAILLLVFGAGLALLEVFITSAGILGVLAALSLVAAVVLGFYESALTGFLILLIEAIGMPTLVILAFKYWPKTAIGKRILLAPPKSEDVLPDDPVKQQLKDMVGKLGRAKSKLLLSGVIAIDGQTVDAVSESQPVEAGETVRVIQVRGNRVVVRPVDEAEISAASPLERTYDDPFITPPA